VSNNASSSQATEVVLSDTLPLSTTFAWASGDYTYAGDAVSWDLGTISPSHQINVTLVVSVGITVPSGTAIVNADYRVRSRQVPTPVAGAPAMALVPWQFYLQFILKKWP
jgi:hypothetical protein